MKVSGLRTNARRGGSEARPSTPATGGRFSAGRAPHIAPLRGRRAGTTGTGANLRARRRRPAASTCAPLQKGACAAGTAGASGSGRRPKARSLQLYNTRETSLFRALAARGGYKSIRASARSLVSVYCTLTSPTYQLLLPPHTHTPTQRTFYDRCARGVPDGLARARRRPKSLSFSRSN